MIYREQKDRRAELQILNNQAIVHRLRGDLDSALAIQRRVLTAREADPSSCPPRTSSRDLCSGSLYPLGERPPEAKPRRVRGCPAGRLTSCASAATFRSLRSGNRSARASPTISGKPAATPSGHCVADGLTARAETFEVPTNLRNGPVSHSELQLPGIEKNLAAAGKQCDRLRSSDRPSPSPLPRQTAGRGQSWSGDPSVRENGSLSSPSGRSRRTSAIMQRGPAGPGESPPSALTAPDRAARQSCSGHPRVRGSRRLQLSQRQIAPRGQSCSGHPRVRGVAAFSSHSARSRREAIMQRGPTGPGSRRLQLSQRQIAPRGQSCSGHPRVRGVAAFQLSQRQIAPRGQSCSGDPRVRGSRRLQLSQRQIAPRGQSCGGHPGVPEEREPSGSHRQIAPRGQ